MTMSEVTKTLTIFEGPDGSGKTTLAKAYARLIGAQYVHFGPLPRVSSGLARMYVEAMLPALLGLQDVVFDRCWLSESPYGQVFRGGRDRLGYGDRRMLERLAWRCAGVVVKCLPPFEAVRSNFLARKGEEYLDNDDQLRNVYSIYEDQTTDLNELHYDYTSRAATIGMVAHDIEMIRPLAHYTNARSAGNRNARIALIGESFAEPKNEDPFYQWPFASFSQSGCSQWLARQLDQAGVGEDQLFWGNIDQAIHVSEVANKRVFALGSEVSKRLVGSGVTHTLVPHPQAWKRFHAGEPYPLIQLLKEAIHEL